MHTLVDADCAINAMMWQNAGRSGFDQWNFKVANHQHLEWPGGGRGRGEATKSRRGKGERSGMLEKVCSDTL